MRWKNPKTARLLASFSLIGVRVKPMNGGGNGLAGPTDWPSSIARREEGETRAAPGWSLTK